MRGCGFGRGGEDDRCMDGGRDGEGVMEEEDVT